jgi:glucan phosphoethanolaminetransferase (alkaline phosphatase superfamily)
MLQRIQSVYLFFAFVVSAVLPFVFYLWIDAKETKVFFMTNIIYTILFGLSATLAILSLMTYKKRQQQFVMNRLNMILNLILLGLFVYRTLNVSGGANAPEKGIGMFLPIATILLLVLANRAIKKDEDLVKSVDRLR